jgi:hypothetical protein
MNATAIRIQESELNPARPSSTWCCPPANPGCMK